MEKETLTTFEEKCIQEELAFCAAACPFHLDVKAFLLQMEQGQVDKVFTPGIPGKEIPDIVW